MYLQEDGEGVKDWLAIYVLLLILQYMVEIKTLFEGIKNVMACELEKPSVKGMLLGFPIEGSDAEKWY